MAKPHISSYVYFTNTCSKPSQKPQNVSVTGCHVLQDNKPVVYFAGYKGHIGFYPTAKPIEHFKELLMSYKTSKGAIQFNINEPLPIELIKEITCFRLNQLDS